jgi:predicted TIM-barrel fold metal-dependent hydrolase
MRMTSHHASIKLNDLDRRIWAEELEAFVPSRIFDVHTHYYRWEFNTDPAKESGMFADLVGEGFPESDRERADAWDAALLPGRQVHRLSFGFPFWPACDFEAMNGFVAEQAARAPESAALMLVHPSMSPQYIEEQIRGHGFLGLKPYRFYAVTGDSVECRITDFLPEEQIAAADRLGLIVTLHLAKRNAIADPENLADMLRLSEKYPGVKWILAHCARSYSAWVIEQAVTQLRGLPNVWYDVSSVCEADVIEALMAGVGPDRVMYGSDDLPVGAARGKYIVFGRAWAFLSERNHRLDLSHCDPRMTFVRYEQLRAMRRAAMRLGLGGPEIEDLFHNTAARLIHSMKPARGGTP